MFEIDGNSIFANRGDVVFFSVEAQEKTTETDENGEPYIFQPGDVVRMTVYGKKNANNVVMQKDFPVFAESESVAIFLSEEDTKLEETISKPKEYWYEIVLNPESNPQTIIGYDEEGAKVFTLYPEGDDISYNPPEIDPDDIPIVDDELDLTSKRPIENQAVARAIARLEAEIEALKKGGGSV